MSFLGKYFSKVVLTAMAALLLFGVVEIFALRFSRGDLYPRYSTSRPDPFGCKALFETLRELGIETERIYKPIREISDPEKTALVRTGVYSLSDPIDGKELRDFVLSGGCFIGFFAPDVEAPVDRKKESDTKNGKKSESDDRGKRGKDSKEGKESGKRESDGEDVPKRFFFNFMDRIGCRLMAERKKDAGHLTERTAVPSDETAVAGVKPIKTFSKNYFAFSEPSKWTTLMETNGKPVLATRTFGKGRITLCATSYPISNEGLAKSKNAELVSLLIPKNRRILFDEHSLGLQEVKNIAWLFKKHKLHLLLAVLAMAAALFVWGNMASLSNIPSTPTPAFYDSAPVESGISNADALGDLIKRNIDRREMIDVCVSEWVKTARARNIPEDDIKRVKEIAGKFGKSDPVLAYSLISQALDKTASFNQTAETETERAG